MADTDSIRVAPIGVVLDQALAMVHGRWENGEPIPGLPTGFADLDRLVGGLLPGTLTVIAGVATPALDALAVAVTLNVSANGHLVLYASTRANQIDLALRLASATSRVPFVNCWRGRLTRDEWTRLQSGTERLGTCPIVLLDRPHPPTADLCSMVTAGLATQAKARPAVLLVDRLSEVAADATTSPGDALRVLLDLAADENVAVVAVEQTGWPSADRTDRRPVISDLPQADLLVYYATTMILTYDDAVFDPNSADRGTIEANVVLNRFGPLGMIRLAHQHAWGIAADLHRG